MRITTAFNCGDRAWVYMDGARQLTIGRVSVEITDTPGIEQDGIVFDNFKAAKSRVERYMCIETGVGSGRVYTMNEHIFRDEASCIAGSAKQIKAREDEKAAEAKWRHESLLRQEAEVRRQLAAIEAAKAVTA